MLIFGRDQELALWAGDRVGIENFGPCVSIGVAHAGEIVAVAVYNQYAHPNIHITFATSSPRWASPGAVKAIFRYPFVQLKCKRITALTGLRNESAIRFLNRLGFKEEGIHPEVFMDDDAVSFGLLAKDAARWLT